jgi:hypothetical protein
VICYSIKEKNQKYAFKHTGNADETAVHMPRNYTLDSRGAKKLKLKAQVMQSYNC